MDIEPDAPYPGEKAEACEVLDLAHAYYGAAMILLREAHALTPLSFAPVRLCAIHAIELYVNAFLRHEGFSPGKIRARLHDLSEPSLVATVRLTKKTALHLEALSDRREYLIARYGPEQISQHTEVNRLQATLGEMMMKVGRHLRPAAVRRK